MTGLRARDAAGLYAAGAVLALAVLAPLLAPGYVLAYDMIFTPRQPLLPDSLGLGSALPRAVPVDAVVALLTTVVPGAVVQKVALVAAILAATVGAGRLVPADRTAARLVAASLYGWNAYVAERLFIGHWTLLLAYASLPWVVSAALRLRRGEPHAWAALVLASASRPAASSPSPPPSPSSSPAPARPRILAGTAPPAVPFPPRTGVGGGSVSWWGSAGCSTRPGGCRPCCIRVGRDRIRRRWRRSRPGGKGWVGRWRACSAWAESGTPRWCRAAGAGCWYR